MYRIIRFGTVDLAVYNTHYNQVDNISSGVTPTAYQTLSEGGALDLYGSQQKHPSVVRRTKSLRLGVPSSETAVSDLETLFFQLIELRGTRNRLYRQTASGDIHWQYARLIEVVAERTFETTKFKRIQDITLEFETQDTFWRGDLGGEWYLDSGEFLDAGLVFDSAQTYALASSPTNFAITIGASADVGRAPVRAVRIVFKAGTANRSNITISRSGGESITFNSTVLANKQLVIDTGTMQVTNDGVDAYSNIVFSPTADLAVWFSLLKGTNNITVSFTGAGTGATIEFSYYESWY